MPANVARRSKGCLEDVLIEIRRLGCYRSYVIKFPGAVQCPFLKHKHDLEHRRVTGAPLQAHMLNNLQVYHRNNKIGNY